MIKKMLTLIIIIFAVIIIFSACSAYTGALRTGEDTFIIAENDNLYHAKQQGRKLILKPYQVIKVD